MHNTISRTLSATLMLASVAATADPVTIGTTQFALGDDAFPSASACLDPTGCGSPDNKLIDFTLPLMPAVSAARALLGHRLDLVALDLDAIDEIRLEFPVPITNQPGGDIYLAQVVFINTADGLGDAQGINDMGIRFGSDLTWHDITVLDFIGDLELLGPVYVTYQDPEIKQDAYAVQGQPAPAPPLAGLWYAPLDLSEFGFDDGAEIQQLTIRGSTNLSGSGLDLAIVGNLNQIVSVPEPELTGLVGGITSIMLLAAAGLVRGPQSRRMK